MVVWEYHVRIAPTNAWSSSENRPGIARNADDWAVVSVSASALYGASANAYAGKTRLRM